MPSGIYKRTEYHKKAISLAKKGKAPKNLSALIEFFKSSKGRAMRRELQRGDKNPAWKGGVTHINQKIRTSSGYKDWRTAVFQRDDYTCQMCRDRGVTLQADHIKPFAYYPELRLVVENGRTLCVPCHRKTDSYAGKILTWQPAHAEFFG